MAEGNSALVNFLSDPATLATLAAVAAGTAWYISSRPSPVKSPVPLDNQSIELPVSLSRFIVKTPPPLSSPFYYYYCCELVLGNRRRNFDNLFYYASFGGLRGVSLLIHTQYISHIKLCRVLYNNMVGC